MSTPDIDITKTVVDFEALRTSGDLGPGMQKRADKLSRDILYALEHPSFADYIAMVERAASMMRVWREIQAEVAA